MTRSGLQFLRRKKIFQFNFFFFFFFFFVKFKDYQVYTVDPDEMTHNELSHLDLQSMQIKLLLCLALQEINRYFITYTFYISG